MTTFNAIDTLASITLSLVSRGYKRVVMDSGTLVRIVSPTTGVALSIRRERSIHGHEQYNVAVLDSQGKLFSRDTEIITDHMYLAAFKEAWKYLREDLLKAS